MTPVVSKTTLSQAQTTSVHPVDQTKSGNTGVSITRVKNACTRFKAITHTISADTSTYRIQLHDDQIRGSRCARKTCGGREAQNIRPSMIGERGYISRRLLAGSFNTCQEMEKKNEWRGFDYSRVVCQYSVPRLPVLQGAHGKNEVCPERHQPVSYQAGTVAMRVCVARPSMPRYRGMRSV